MPLAPSSSLSKLALSGSLVVTAAAVSQSAVITTLDSSFTLPSSPNTTTLQFNLATGEIGLNNAITNPQFFIRYAGGLEGKAQLVGVSGTRASVLFTFDDAGGAFGQGGYYVLNVPPGSQVSANSGGAYGDSNFEPYLGQNQNSATRFRTGVTGYAGLQIPDPSNPNQLDYGYAAITYNADNSITVSRLAYENTGAPITVVPEPSTLATSLLALVGAVGAVAARRKRMTKNVAVQLGCTA